MAITRHSNFDKTVQTILDRNNIPNKVDGMMVVVLDAIADVDAGNGKAIYRYDASESVWILVSKTTGETLNFVTEELLIVNNEVTLSYIPVDNQVWNAVIINGQLIYNDLNISDVVISNGKITGLSNDVNGMKLRVTYAYGSLTQQISTVIEDAVDNTLANNIKTINGESVIGVGDIIVSTSFDIASTEYNTSLKRGTKYIYGIEVDLGYLPNTGTKEITFAFNTTYDYWIDNQYSYCSNSNVSYPLNYNGNIGENISCFLDKTNDKIKVSTSDDKSNFIGKVVILYTK